MAWVNTKLLGHQSVSANNGSEKTATDYYLVEFDANATAVQAETAEGIPELGDDHPDDDDRKVKNVSSKASSDDGSRLYWVVQVDYGTKSSSGQPLISPLSVPAEVTWDFQAATQPYFMDHSDPPKPTANSAGEPFEELLQRETGSITVTYKKNIAANAWNPGVMATYMSEEGTAVNEDGITIDGFSIAAGQAKFGGATCSPVQTQNGVSYRERTIVLKLTASWDQTVADRGFNELDDGKLKEIVKGTPPVKVDRAWPLDGEGAKKGSAGDSPEMLTFKPYPARSFSGFSFA